MIHPVCTWWCMCVCVCGSCVYILEDKYQYLWIRIIHAYKHVNKRLSRTPGFTRWTLLRFECTPLSLTLSCRSVFAPAPRRSSTTLWWPLKLAVLSAVWPSCMAKSVIVNYILSSDFLGKTRPQTTNCTCFQCINDFFLPCTSSVSMCRICPLSLILPVLSAQWILHTEYH